MQMLHLKPGRALFIPSPRDREAATASRSALASRWNSLSNQERDAELEAARQLIQPGDYIYIVSPSVAGNAPVIVTSAILYVHDEAGVPYWHVKGTNTTNGQPYAWRQDMDGGYWKPA